MEGDAGTGRLNPIDKHDSTGSAATDTEATDTEATTKATQVAEVGAEATDTEATTKATQVAEVGAEATDTAATDTEATTATPVADSTDPTDEASTEAADESEAAEQPEVGPDEQGAAGIERRPSRVNRAWLAAIAALLVIASGAVAFGGYVALRYYQDVQATSRNDASALQIAKDCVVATQAPDTSSMAASEQKIIDCGTDQYRTQALLYSSMLVQAYQAANVHLKVTDVRAAVERNNPDGTVDVLVALRVKVSNDQAQDQEAGYRLRVKMTPSDGSYKISRLEQVTK